MHRCPAPFRGQAQHSRKGPPGTDDQPAEERSLAECFALLGRLSPWHCPLPRPLKVSAPAGYRAAPKKSSGPLRLSASPAHLPPRQGPPLHLYAECAPKVGEPRRGNSQTNRLGRGPHLQLLEGFPSQAHACCGQQRCSGRIPKTRTIAPPRHSSVSPRPERYWARTCSLARCGEHPTPEGIRLPLASSKKEPAESSVAGDHLRR
jgi:hypothetical protein